MTETITDKSDYCRRCGGEGILGDYDSYQRKTTWEKCWECHGSGYKTITVERHMGPGKSISS